MKTIRLIGLYLVFSFLFNANIFAQSASDNNKMIHQDEHLKAQHYTQVVDNYLRGLNEKDLATILFLYAENATVEDPVGSDIVNGMPALREFYTAAVGYDLQLTRTGPVRVADKEAAFPFELVMKVNGVLTKTDIIDVFRFDEDGKIVSMRAFWGPTNQSPMEE